MGSGAKSQCRGTEAGLPRKPWGLLLPSQGLQPSESGLLSLQPHTERLRRLVELAREQILRNQAAIPGRGPRGSCASHRPQSRHSTERWRKAGRAGALRKAFGYNRVRAGHAQHLLEGKSPSPAFSQQKGRPLKFRGGREGCLRLRPILFLIEKTTPIKKLLCFSKAKAT